MPIRLLKPSTGPLSDTFAEHAARYPARVARGDYSFCGQDIGWRAAHAAEDWRIVASHGGTVERRYNADYGNHLLITDPSGFQTLYGHLSAFAVDDGARVSVGTHIGTMGQSGNAAGTHLHHELRINGGQVDPAPYYVDSLAALAGFIGDPLHKPGRHNMTTLFYLGQKDGSFTYAIAGDYPGGGDANWQEFQFMAGNDALLGTLDDDRIAALKDQFGEPIGLDLATWQAKRDLYTAPLPTGGGSLPDPVQWGTAAGKAVADQIKSVGFNATGQFK